MYSQNDYDLVEAVATDLINKNGITTTKEIKDELRLTYPGAWYQSQISDIMKDLSDNQGIFSFDDNGHFREYKFVVPVIDLDDDDYDVDPIADTKLLAPNQAPSIPIVHTPAPKASVLTRLRKAFFNK